MGKKELIVSSAKKVILEKGYKNISVEDITNEAGIANRRGKEKISNRRF